MKFQSTRPARGATFATMAARPAGVFQSTRPARGATAARRGAAWRRPGFNPRAPRGARLGVVFLHGLRLEVSIHAPRAGRDRPRTSRSTSKICFNPRAPRGARPSLKNAVPESESFQSTRPARGATHLCIGDALLGRVSIHAPRAGRDSRLCCGPKASDRFQSTRPARGATTRRIGNRLAVVVSIHAPRAGRDPAWIKDQCDASAFQSTRPARGATGV